MKKLYIFCFLLLPAFLLLQPIILQSQTNQYLHFDRVDDYVVLENASQYIANSDGISMTGWFFCDELGYGQGMIGFRTSGNGFYLIQLNNGQVECRLETGNGLFEVVSPPNSTIAGLWQHWAWVYDGTQVLLYIDGNLIGTDPASGQITNTAFSFSIGKSLLSGFNFVYGGRVDEVTAWSKALNPSEIADMMSNELIGSEANLELYYKMNQGDPGGNNTTITHLLCEIGNGERDAELMNFALVGEESNFNGEVDPGFQAISFAQIANHLTTDTPFELDAVATSGLEVFFEVISGPATVDGNLLTLNGTAGEVVIEATQPGNGTYDPAEPVINAFMVVDPNTNTPNIDPRNPLPGDVYVPLLDYIKLATYTTIDYPELFDVQSVEFSINGQSFNPTNWGEGYYSGWWMPPNYGNYTLTITAINNFNASSVETININVVDNASDMEVLAVDGIWISTDNPSIVVDAELPSYTGAFDQVSATLEVLCPTGGCGEWDRLASVDARGHNGEWVEIIRYITPYGVPCSHVIDLSDYMSILQGKVSFRINCFTLDNGYEYDLTINYSEGTPIHNFSDINIIWWETYQFGDYENLQPVVDVDFTFPSNSVGATLKLVSTGHGWGNLNTGNAAEFHNDTHHIWINGEQTFEQHNWAICSPNPDGCQPQFGTYGAPRAGWCPGSIAPWFDYNMDEFVTEEDITLGYIFNEDYVDYCHPNHPACVTGTTCADCDDGFNPHLVVACNLVVFSDSPVDSATIVSIDGKIVKPEPVVSLLPNPTNGILELSCLGNSIRDQFSVEVLNITGKQLQKFEWDGENKTIDLSDYPAGIYFFQIIVNGKKEMHKVIVH